MDIFQILATCDPNLLTIIKFIRQGIFPIIQIGIPIILIIMGSIDLGKAVLSSDDKEIKAATGKLIKRAIAAVAVFFVSTIVSLLMGMFQGNETDAGNGLDWSKCWAHP
ncbi:MAG: hypothetical protein RR047_01975, partial [Bacilli bacterium]